MSVWRLAPPKCVVPTGTPGLATGGVAPGDYYLAVSAFNAGGSSAESPEVLLAMPAAGACDVPPAPALTTGAWGNFLTASWTPVPGAVAYLLSAAGPGGLNAVVPFGGGTTSFIYPGLPVGHVELRHPGAVRLRCAQRPWRVGTRPSTGRRCACSRGLRINTYSFPDFYLDDVIADIGRRFDGELQQSCREHGGNNLGCSVWFARCANATSVGG